MDAKSRPKINIHGHIRHKDDLPARVRVWEEWNVRHFVCLCMPSKPTCRAPGFIENNHFLPLKKEYGHLLIGFAGVNLHPDHLEAADDIRRYRDEGFQGLKAYGNALPYSHDAYFPIYEVAERLGMPIFFHTGHFGGIDWEHPDLDRYHNATTLNCLPIHLDRIAHPIPQDKMIARDGGVQCIREVLFMTRYFKTVFAEWSGGSGRKPHIRQILSGLLPHPALETN